MSNSTCPQCGGKLPIRTSKKLDKLREAKRWCKCGYRDRVLIRPAEIISIREVYSHTQNELDQQQRE